MLERIIEKNAKKGLAALTAVTVGAIGASAIANSHVTIGEANITSKVEGANITYFDVPTDPDTTVGSYGVNARSETTMRVEFAGTSGWPDWLRDNLTSIKTTAIYNEAESDGATPPVVAESVVSFKATNLRKAVNFDVPLMKDRTPDQANLPTKIVIDVPSDIFEVHSIVPRGNAIDGNSLAFKRNAPATKLKELSVDMEWDWLPDDLPLDLKKDGVTLSQRMDNMTANMGIEAIDEVTNSKCFEVLLDQLPQGTIAPQAPGEGQNITEPSAVATSPTPTTQTLPPFLKEVDASMKKQAADAYNQNNQGGGATPADVTINWPATFNLQNVDPDKKKAQDAYEKMKAKLAEKGINLTIDPPNLSTTTCVPSAGMSTLHDRQDTIDQNANGGTNR
jgi:hypothetical protein